MKENHKQITAVILLISLFQMGMVGLSPIVASITEVFPGVSQVVAQTSMTFLNLMFTLSALISGKLSELIGRRSMSAIGLFLTAIAGFGGFFFSVNIVTAYVWSGLIGVGGGLFVPVASSLMVDYYDDARRGSIASLQTAAVNAGGVIISLASGLLASKLWNISSSLVLSVGPNLGSFISPTVITNLSSLLIGSSVSDRFLLAAILAAIAAVIYKFLK